VNESFPVPEIDANRALLQLQRMIEIPSLPGDEKAFAEYVADETSRLGLKADIFEPDLNTLAAHPAFSPLVTSDTYAGRPNVVAVLKGAGAGRSVLFNAHSDVVPPGPVGRWSGNPWRARFADGRVFGRGALDAKAGVAAVLAALEAITSRGILLRGDVLLECVVDEEAGGNGTLASILKGYQADAGVFVEPSGPGTIYVGHRGGLRFRVTVRGEAAQLFKRDAGVNAIEKMQIVIAALDGFRQERHARARHPAFREVANPVPLYLGEIHGGSWFSSTPLECVLDGTLGWLPGETLASVQQDLRDYILQATKLDPWLAENSPEVTFPSNWIEPCSTDPGAAVVEAACQAAYDVLGQRPRLAMANSGADMRLRCLYAAMPCIWYGPAGANAHGPDEYAEASSVVEMAKIYASLILKWCGTA
jgi:acetylornithine deacetylase